MLDDKQFNTWIYEIHKLNNLTEFIKVHYKKANYFHYADWFDLFINRLMMGNSIEQYCQAIGCFVGRKRVVYTRHCKCRRCTWKAKPGVNFDEMPTFDKVQHNRSQNYYACVWFLLSYINRTKQCISTSRKLHGCLFDEIQVTCNEQVSTFPE
jgi:hypothetical protein